MYMEIKDNKKIIFKSDNKNDVINNLMFYLYSIAILKDKSYKVKYQYNYSDLQIITIRQKYDELNTREIIFYNIPTRLGYLDTDTILK